MRLQLFIFFATFTIMAQNGPIYLDSSVDIENRLSDLMARMTLEEKVAQMCQYVGLEHMKKAEKSISAEELIGNDALGFYKNLHSSQVAQMVIDGKIGSFLHVKTAEESNYLQSLAEKSRLKIPLIIGIDAIHGNALVSGTTVYPTPINMAASFDNYYPYQIARETAIEMRATGSHWSFTPNIDVMRDPRWGRVGETFGEDPFLVGEMGVAMINGFQQGDYTGIDKVIACAKHMIGGGEPINGLNASPMDVSERTLYEIHLPPYKKAIDAGVYSIMAAHNELNGIPCHMHKELMTDLFRGDWNFDGFYVSDWMDIERIEKLHRVAENFKEASFLSVDAGMDMHMHGPHFLENIVELVEEGRISIERVNEASEKILRAKFKLGLFENRYVDLTKVDSRIFTKQHKQTALDAARHSITLLKNKDGILPLKKANKKIFVTGPNANNPTTLGDWHFEQPEQNVITIYEGIQQLAPSYGYEVNFFDSGQNLRDIKTNDINRAAEMAGDADYAVVVVGENSLRYKWKQKTAGENMARADLKLPGRQLELVKAIYKTGTPILLVLVNGRPISEPWLQENIPAIIETWEPGSLGGQALAEILFGEVNPSGKLPLTIPRSVGQLQMIYNHKPSQYFHKYAFEKTKPLYRFGFGLSYTTFSISKPKLSKSKWDGTGELLVEVDVKNTGDREGMETVQLYIRDLYSSVTRPVLELKGYKKINLTPGETKRLSFNLMLNDFAFYDSKMKYKAEEGEFNIFVGNSANLVKLKKSTLELTKNIYINEN
jgi:beta-glucosidase